MELTKLQESLFDFVKECHGNQARKYTGAPYWTHLYAVATYTQGCDIKMGVEVALCHDLFEDTTCDFDKLNSKLQRLGYSETDSDMICIGVEYLTDKFTKEKYPELNRKERKERECKRLSKIPRDCQTIKYADLIDNSESIVEHDLKFADVYLQEKGELLNAMRKGDFSLYIFACHYLVVGTAKLKAEQGKSKNS